MATTKDPVRVAVTGAAGNIGYALVFRIASGAMLGPDQPVILQLKEITPALDALRGVVMELEDCAFPLLRGVQITDQDDEALGDVDFALLVGSMPRKEGMERSDLLSANGGIFKPQGEALSAGAKRDVKVLVVGNPANTNCLIAQQHAKDLDPDLLHRDDAARPQPRRRPARRQGRRPQHRRAQDDDLGQPLGHPVPRRVPRGGRGQARLRGDRSGPELARGRVHPHGPAARRRHHQGRGALSSAASAANAAIDHVRDWVLGTPDGDWVSMGVVSDGSYGTPEGIVTGFPCTTKDGTYQIVQGLELDDFSRSRIDTSNQELVDERDAVRELGSRSDTSDEPHGARTSD